MKARLTELIIHLLGVENELSSTHNLESLDYGLGAKRIYGNTMSSCNTGILLLLIKN